MTNLIFQMKSIYFSEIIQKFVSNHNLKFYANKNEYEFKIGNLSFKITINNNKIILTRSPGDYIEVYDFNEYDDAKNTIFSHYVLERKDEKNHNCKCTKVFTNGNEIMLSTKMVELELFNKEYEEELYNDFSTCVYNNLEETIVNMKYDIALFEYCDDNYKIDKNDDIYNRIYDLEHHTRKRNM